MELNEKLNQSYNKDKKIYNMALNFEKDIKSLQEELKLKKREKEDAQIKKIRANEDKDKKKEENADKEIEHIDKEIQDIKAKIEKKKQVISKSKEKVDSYINELSKDSEFKAHMNSILEKKYNRARRKAIKDKGQTDLIIDLCIKHPSLEMNLKGMVRAAEENTKIKEQWKKLEDELKILNPIADKARIDEIKNIEIPSLASAKAVNDKKSNMNKKSFMDFAKKNNIAIESEFLKKLTEENSFAHDKGTGEIKVLTSLEKISKGYDKQIRNYEKSIEKIPGAKIDNEAQKQEKTKDKKQKSKNNLPDKKYKWYQFGKRFNAWREKKRVEKETKKEEQTEKNDKAKESSKFRDAYKYDIVKDYIDKREKEIYKEAKEDKKKGKEESER